MDQRKFVFCYISRSDAHQKKKEKKREIVATTPILMNPTLPSTIENTLIK